MYVYQAIAGLLVASVNCDRKGNHDVSKKHRTDIETLVRQHLPSGSGFDNGTHFSFSESTPEKLVFKTAFHHMDEHGYYDGWTDHVVTLRPSLVYGFTMKITGRNRNAIKDYIGDCFYHSLRGQCGEQEAV